MLLKGQKSLYRYVGIIGATFTIAQCCIWLPLSLHATMCYYHPYYVTCGDVEKEKSFSRCFYLMYFQTDTEPYPNLIKPVIFNLLMWVYLIMTLVISFTSIRLLIAFCSWSKRKSIMKAEFIWTRVILICSFIEFILFIVFVADIISINNSEERGCLVSSNGTMPKHSQLGDLSYLEHVKTTLEEMKMIVQKKKVELKEMETNMTDIKSTNLFLTEHLFNENDNDWRKIFGSPVINNTYKKFEKDDLDFINNFKEFLHISDDEIIDWDDADYDLINNFNDFLKININEYEAKESTKSVTDTITSTAETDKESSENAPSGKTEDETTREYSNTSDETLGSSFGYENTSKPKSSSGAYSDYVTSAEKEYDSDESEGTMEEPDLGEKETSFEEENLEPDKEETSSKNGKSEPDKEEISSEEEDSKLDGEESESDEGKTKPDRLEIKPGTEKPNLQKEETHSNFTLSSWTTTHKYLEDTVDGEESKLGESTADKEETTPDEGESTPDEGELTPDEEDSTPDGEERNPYHKWPSWDFWWWSKTTTHKPSESIPDGEKSKLDNVESESDEKESEYDEAKSESDDEQEHEIEKSKLEDETEEDSKPKTEKPKSEEKEPISNFTHNPIEDVVEVEETKRKTKEPKFQIEHVTEVEKSKLKTEKPKFERVDTNANLTLPSWESEMTTHKPVENIDWLSWDFWWWQETTTYKLIEYTYSSTESKPDEEESNFYEELNQLDLEMNTIYNKTAQRKQGDRKLSFSFPKFNLWGFWWVEATTTHTPIMDVVSEICESCTYWIIAPSAVCMILSIKIGLVWLINIATALSLIYLGKIAKLTPSLLLSPNFG